MNKIALNLHGISKTYHQGSNTLTILKDLDLSVEKGSMTALVGPSGSGKSTLLHICGLMDMPTSGEVTIDGISCKHLSDRKRTEIRCKKIGFIFQFHHLLPEFTALENIIIPQLIAGVSQKNATARAISLLERVGLKNRLHHRPGKLSGGEQQRVAIARSIANNPSLLLADEPTGSLDPETAESVFRLFVDLCREEKVGALVVTHNLELAAKMDSTFTLSHGHVI